MNAAPTTPPPGTWADRHPERPYGIYVISANRPANVPAITDKFAPDPLTWVVPHGQRHEYRATGAETVLPVRDPGPGRHSLPAQRNAALNHAIDNGLVCIQTDDDLKHFSYATGNKNQTVRTTWPEVRNTLIGHLDGEAHLSGGFYMENALYSRKTLYHYGFIIASLHAADSRYPQWDETLALKEDYDYTCAHLDLYGTVARPEWLMPAYHHYSNRGGAVETRTAALETRIAETLVRRWPQYLRLHNNRDGEIAFIPRRRGEMRLMPRDSQGRGAP